MKTAVDFIIESVMSRGIYTTEMLEEFEQAKEMFEEQIMEAYDSGLFDGTMDIVKDRMYKKYYNETYGGDK